MNKEKIEKEVAALVDEIGRLRGELSKLKVGNYDGNVGIETYTAAIKGLSEAVLNLKASMQ